MVDRYDVMVTIPAEREGGKDAWYKIGTAFASRTGSGYTVYMGATPIPHNGRIKFLLMDPNRFGDRRPAGPSSQGNWQQRTPPGPARRPPMPIDRGAPPLPQGSIDEGEDDGWPGPR
jgi:hypothetical protein